MTGPAVRNGVIIGRVRWSSPTVRGGWAYALKTETAVGDQSALGTRLIARTTTPKTHRAGLKAIARLPEAGGSDRVEVAADPLGNARKREAFRPAQ